jgi:hypothetical protein
LNPPVLGSSQSKWEYGGRLSALKMVALARTYHPTLMKTSAILFPLKISLNAFRSAKAEAFNSVIPAWRAGIQVDMDVSARIRANLDTGYPCRYDELWLFIFLYGSGSL